MYTGCFPIAPTTFDECGALDLESQNRVVDFLVDAGVGGICILANYSEQFSLDDDERETLTTAIIDHVAGRVPVIITTSHFSTKIAAARSCRAQDAGAAMVMLMPPYHGATLRVTEEAIAEFFRVQIRQCGVGAQRLGHPIALSPRRRWLPHRVTAPLFEHRQHAFDGPLGGGIGHPEEVTQRLLREVMAQPDHGEQNLLALRQAAVPPPTDRPLPPRTILRSVPRLSQGRPYVPHQVLEQGDGQARHRLKDGRFPAQVGRAQQHRAVLQQFYRGGLPLAYPSHSLW